MARAHAATAQHHRLHGRVADPVSRTPQQHTVTIADLDFVRSMLTLVKPDNQQAMTELDDRIVRRVTATWNPRPDADIQIQYLKAGAAPLSLFETSPLLRELRTLVTHSRPLRATDVKRPSDASSKDDARVFADAARISTPLLALKTLGQDVATLAVLEPRLADPVANHTAIIADVDNCLAQAAALLERASRFGLPSSGWGFTYGWLHLAFADLLKDVSALTTLWTKKLNDFTAALLAYDALPAATPGADRFAALQAAELLVSSHLDPLPATPSLLRAALNGKGTAFQNRLTDFSTALKNPTTSFVTLFNLIGSLTTAEFDAQPFDIAPFGDRAVIVTEDVARILGGVSGAIATRASRPTIN
jgi:hypothetical protein